MGLINNIEVRPLESVKGGTVDFYTPQSSHETMLVQIPPATVENLFVHRFQTDQLLVVRGSVVLVVLRNRQYEYIPLIDTQPTVVKIPPGILHSAINLSSETCVVVNAVLRHGTPHERDYQPIKPPFPYDLELAKAKLREVNCSANPQLLPVA